MLDEEKNVGDVVSLPPFDEAALKLPGFEEVSPPEIDAPAGLRHEWEARRRRGRLHDPSDKWDGRAPTSQDSAVASWVSATTSAMRSVACGPTI
jgi:hypothetical protein